MKITWLGHSAFRVETGNSIIMIDPFLSGNPAFEGNAADAWTGASHVLLTHGHEDHVGDAKEICTKTGATLVAVYEICVALGVEKFEPANTGGTIFTDDFDVTFVRADHSSSFEGKYMGNPCGLIVRPKPVGPVLYHMGDTDIFSDMALINELYEPDIGIVPIGDRFTMSAKTAAIACYRYFNFSTILPCHYKTFPLLAQSADEFVNALGDKGATVSVLDVLQSIEV